MASGPISSTEAMPTSAPNDMHTTVLTRPSVLPPLWKKLAQATKACHTCIWKAASGPKNNQVATTASRPMATASANNKVMYVSSWVE
ncbi:hypothetical protein D9M68_818870 [compost metagenome]